MIQIESPNDEILNDKTLKILKNLHNVPDVFYLLTFILAIDYGVNIVFEKNLLTFEWSQLTPGIVIVFFATFIFFALMANTLLAVSKYFLLHFLSSTIEKIRTFFKDNTYDIPDQSYKDIFQLRNEALKEENDFKLKILNDHEIRYAKLASKKLNFLNIIFKFFLLLILDLYFTKTESSMQFIIGQLPPFLYNLALVALILLVLVWLREMYETDENEYYIKWPK